MKVITFIVFLLCSQIICCQEFTYNLYFSDSKGNKDTLILGYDSNATDTIDTKFGELDIKRKSLNPVFDVRISNLWLKQSSSTENDSFQTKKQIVQKRCGYGFPAITIDLLCSNWPVSVKWDSSLFVQTCNRGSILTSFHPGGWFDVGGGFIMPLSKRSSLKIYKSKYQLDYYYVNSKNDTIYVFWQAFSDSSLLHLDVKKSDYIDEFTLYPNPSNGLFKINGDLSKILNVQISDLTGKTLFVTTGDSFDLKEIRENILVVTIRLKNGQMIRRKIINTR